MRQPSIPFALIVLIVSLTNACSSSPTSPTASSSPTAYTAAQLEGTWQVASIQPAGAAKQDRPSGATYSLTFANDRLSTRADCNQCSGPFSISSNTLTAGPVLACTRAACPTMAFESAYTSILSGDSQPTLTGSTLTLTSVRGTIWLVR